MMRAGTLHHSFFNLFVSKVKAVVSNDCRFLFWIKNVSLYYIIFSSKGGSQGLAAAFFISPNLNVIK